MKVMLCMLRKFFSHNLKHFQRYCKLLKFGLFYPTLHFSNKRGVGFAQCQETLDGHSTKCVGGIGGLYSEQVLGERG